MKVSVYGCGYVGLVTGICLAELGHEVLCVDVNQAKVENLSQGKLPIYEIGLQPMLDKCLEQGCIQFSGDMQAAIGFGVVQLIAVGTPSSADGSADLTYVLSVCESLGRDMHDYRLIINKSTVPVGSNTLVKARIQQLLSERGNECEFDVVSNPEFLREGQAVEDFMCPHRIVVGVESDRAKKLMSELYAPLIQRGVNYHEMKPASAELTKYAANSFLATKISFMNEIALLAEKVGADVLEVERGMKNDPRIGELFLKAGCGYGGSCFPKDVRALRVIGESVGVDMQLAAATDLVNERQKRHQFQQIMHFFSDRLVGRTIAVWGLAFKPGTDDMREASSLSLIQSLLQVGAQVKVYDPLVKSIAIDKFNRNANLHFCDSAIEALHEADVLALVTEWDEFRKPDVELLKQKLKYPVVFDGRNVLSVNDCMHQGLYMFGIGRGALSVRRCKEILRDDSSTILV